MVNVGTQTREIETGLRKYFRKLAWINRFDVPMSTKVSVRMGGSEGG